MRKSKRKTDARLAARLADHAKTMVGSRENKVDTRIKTGGFHTPGSRNK